MIKDYRVQKRANLRLAPTKQGTLRSGLGSGNGGERTRGRRERGGCSQNENKLKKNNNTIILKITESPNKSTTERGC